MPKVKRGKKGQKTQNKAKVKTRKRVEIDLPAPMVDIKVKFDPDDQTFTYRDAEKEMEAENEAVEYGMSVSEYVRSVRPELVRDIKPKIEPVVKEEPIDQDFENNEPISKRDAEMNDEMLDDPPGKRQPNKKSTECPICQKSFKSNWLLRQHGAVHAEKTLKCDVCDKLFNLKSNLIVHKRIHLSNRETYPCDICKKEFRTKVGLRGHRRSHDLSRKLFECQICLKKFFSLNGLKEHIQRLHEGKEKQKCKFCNRRFACNRSRMAHMRSEHFALLRQQVKGTGDLHEIFKGIRTYECYRCKYSTSVSAYVKSHMEKCEGINPSQVECDLCKNPFKNSRRLKIHLRETHSIYERKLTTDQMLKKAKQVFECIDCKMYFMRKNALIRHIKFWCSKRGFRCDYCCQTFQRQTDKNHHHRFVHPILLKTTQYRKYECHICKVRMQAHMAIKHLAEKHQTKTEFRLNIRRLESSTGTFGNPSIET